MGERYQVTFPPQPPVSSIVEAVQSGARYQRLEPGQHGDRPLIDGWYRLDEDGNPDLSVSTGWIFLLEAEGEMEDITPVRSWSVPQIPPVGTYVVVRDLGRLSQDTGQIWRVRQDAEHTTPYMWTPSVPMSWPEFLAEFGTALEWRATSPRDDDLDAWTVKLFHYGID